MSQSLASLSPSPPPPYGTPSPDGSIVPTTTTAIRDFNNNLWTLDLRNRVILNDKAENSTKGTQLLLWFDGMLYRET